MWHNATRTAHIFFSIRAWRGVSGGFLRVVLLGFLVLLVMGCDPHEARHCHVLLEDREDDLETEAIEKYITRLDCPFLEEAAPEEE
jgi:hypothetical protein